MARYVKQNRFRTGYIFGRNLQGIKFSSCTLHKQESAQSWADYLNGMEADKPNKQRKFHFVVELHSHEETP